MIDYVRGHLGAKLFLSYLAIILVGLAVLTVAGQFALPSSFNRHMLGMMGTQGGGLGPGMGPGPLGAGGAQLRSQLYMDYRAGFNDALLVAGLAALLVALALSFFFSRSVTSPVRTMSLASQRIADGHYDERVPVRGSDELSELASRFNRMAERLDQVETLRRQLIGDVSHELRTPLTAIQGSMEGLMDGVLPATSETFQQLQGEAERLNRLVDDLQELSRVEGRANSLRLEPVELAPLVNRVTKSLVAQAASRHVSLSVQIADDLPRALADQDRLVQVLTNLTANGLQYTPAGGTVTITAKPANRELQVSVRDTGIGIPPEHLAHVFDRFYRVDKSRSRQAGGGSGIGLTIARALMEAHGGRIWVESEGEGRGSTFSFTLRKAA
jgi:histidine kinase